MSGIKFLSYFSLNWQMRNTFFFKYATIVYGHADILWTCQGAKIKILIFL